MKMKMRYLGCVNGIMTWESSTRLPGDSRVEQITCRWDWFWGPR